MAQLVASASGVVLGGVAEVVGSIGSVDSLYPSVYIYIYIYIYIYTHTRHTRSKKTQESDSGALGPLVMVKSNI